MVAACPEPAPSSGAGAAQDACGIPFDRPLWIDYADALVPFWKIFAQPGVIAAGSSPSVLPQLRAAGAATAYFDLEMKERVGTPTDPLDPQSVVAESNDRVDRAIARTGCQTPIIAENELFAGDSTKAWTAVEAVRYEQNVLTMMQTMAGRGAHPYLLVPYHPKAVEGVKPSWWRSAARYGTIVPEVYLSARKLSAQGPIAGSRALRLALRRSIGTLVSAGVPPSRIGVMLGFQLGGGSGRDGLEPASAWYRVVKWEVLAARQVSSETPIDSIWSWGWGGGVSPYDSEKETAACVYLWTRSRSLCDALALAGPSFNSSLTETQVKIAPGVRCLVGSRRLTDAQVSELSRLTGSRDTAFSALFARAAVSNPARVSKAAVLDAERAIIAQRFSRSASAYRRALARVGASRALARAVISDELLRERVSATLRVRLPTAREVRLYYRSHGRERVRLVSVHPDTSWLGGRHRGYALASEAPPVLYRIATGSASTLQTALHLYHVIPLEATTTLGRLPLAGVRNAIRSTLVEKARGRAFELWSLKEQAAASRRSGCRDDLMPEVRYVDLTAYLPFLSLRESYPGP